jgi:hypothetical protein
MIARWHRHTPRLRATLTRLARQLGELLLLLLSSPFLVLGLLVGLTVSLTLWIVACILAGYAQGRNRNA